MYTLAVCGTTTIISFILLGPFCLLLGIIFYLFRAKINKKIFLSIEILLIITFLLYSVQYEHYSCRPSMGGGDFKQYKQHFFPTNIFPIKIN